MSILSEVPDDVPAEFLSGVAGFVMSDGEKTEGMGKRDYAYVLNQLTGLERVPAAEDGRASQDVVPADEAGDEAIRPDEYTNTVFESEIQQWARFAFDNGDL